MASKKESIQKWKYDAFLSFRGKDTRNNFVSHLHKHMKDAGIHAFKDDVTLERGSFISPELLKAIEESRFLIIIFSENYASSTWCLEELTKIMECVGHKEMGLQQTAIPIFYHVDPSDVRMRHDTSSFAKAMAKHLKRATDFNKVQRWKDALRKAADISGLHVGKTANGDEATCIEQIVNQISDSVGRRVLSITEHPVGIKSRVEEVKSLLNVKLGGVYYLGISGTGGVGKTTIARAVFDEISHLFEGSGFLANVRGASKEHGSESLEYLQKKLLSQILKRHSLKIGSADEGIKMLSVKKVLIILDDVDDYEQLSHLVGKHE